jgi:hypothetical protein
LHAFADVAVQEEPATAMCAPLIAVVGAHGPAHALPCRAAASFAAARWAAAFCAAALRAAAFCAGDIFAYALAAARFSAAAAAFIIWASAPRVGVAVARPSVPTWQPAPVQAPVASARWSAA